MHTLKIAENTFKIPIYQKATCVLQQVSRLCADEIQGAIILNRHSHTT